MATVLAMRSGLRALVQVEGVADTLTGGGLRENCSALKECSRQRKATRLSFALALLALDGRLWGR
eukprot:5976054-Amphidinium_carterae.1